ncbi:hypothetical protein [Maridesulfovibrio sp.]|uniref:hypothetical protein n=1 Tax=Maridesulfovibrio sp. TaxID=2795000 RepID=UPI003B00C83D
MKKDWTKYFVILINILAIICGYVGITSWQYDCSPSQSFTSCYGLNLVTPKASSANFFGFSQYISALAILAVIYTVTDFKYKFRISVAPGLMQNFSYIGMGAIGTLTLAKDLWFAEKWKIPACLANPNYWQFFLALLFLIIVFLWLYWACIKPPVFSLSNYSKYQNSTYEILFRGNTYELNVLASEICNSANSLIHAYSTKRDSKHKNIFEQACDDLLFSLGNKKFCKQVAINHPETAASLLCAMKEQNKIVYPLSFFIRNISTESIFNTESILYHEDNGFESGLLGSTKPFSTFVYGNTFLISQLGNEMVSPFDIKLNLCMKWNHKQYEVYCRVALLFFEHCLKEKRLYDSFNIMPKIFDTISTIIINTYKIDTYNNFLESDEYEKLKISVEFVQNYIQLLQKYNIKPILLRNKKESDKCFYDDIVSLMCDVITNASCVKSEKHRHIIQHNLVWSDFFKNDVTNRTLSVVQRKLRRVIYNEIKNMEDLPHYLNARLLSISLNVMGVTLSDYKNGQFYTKQYYALHKAILPIVKKNYLSWFEEYPDIAEIMLGGSLNFDKKNKRIVKTYAKTFERTPKQEYLPLNG